MAKPPKQRDPISIGPNNSPVRENIRRHSKSLIIGGIGVGVVVGVVMVGKFVSESQHHKLEGTGTTQSTANGTGNGTVNGAQMAAHLQQSAGGSGKKSPPPKKVPSKTTTSAGKKVQDMAQGGGQSATVDPVHHLVQQAWIQYVTGVIQQTQTLTDERRRALAAGLTAGAGGSDLGVSKAGAGLATTPASFVAPAGNPLAGMFPAGAGSASGADAGTSAASPISFSGGSPDGSASLSAAQKSSYLGKLRGNPDYLPTAREAPISPDVLRAGTVIPAEMETGIDSDLPGQILARVTSNVYSTPDGSQVLVPQGAELIGTYDNQVSQGQTRVLVVWNRIIYPDGSSLDIGTMPGADPSGYSGFHDQVNNHYLRIFGDALVMSIFSAGVQLSQPQASPNSVYSSQQVIAGSLGQQLGQTGQTLINHDMNISPTLKIRQGYRFDVMITRDLVIKPWQSVAALSREANPTDARRSAALWIAEPLQKNHLAPGGLVRAGRDGDTDLKPARAPVGGRPQSLMGPLAPATTAPRQQGGAVMVPSLPLPPTATPAVAPPLPPTPPPAPTWTLSAGRLVGRQMSSWGQSAGWHVIWNAGQDWPVPRGSMFRGSFSSAASQVIEDLAAQGAPIHATFYRGNHTLVVTGVSK